MKKIFNRIIKNFHLLKLFLRELKKERRKIIMTIVGITWGTLTIVILLSFGKGLAEQMKVVNKGLGINIVILYGGQSEIEFQGLPPGRSISLREEDCDLLAETVPYIDRIAAEYDGYGTIRYKDKLINRHIVGVTSPEYQFMRTQFPQMGGRFINEKDIEERRRVVFLGTDLKEDLMGDINAIGETVYINNVPFKVIGVMRDEMQISMYNGPDVAKAVIPSTTFNALFSRQYLSRIIYQVNQVEKSEYVNKMVKQTLSKKYKFHPDDKSALFFWDTIENNKEMSKALTGMNIFLGVVGMLTLVIASVGVANIMFITVRKRTREIGIKRAIGGRKSLIKFQFIMEALLIDVIGGAIGIGFSYIIILLVNSLPETDNMVIQILANPNFSWSIAIITGLILGIVGLMAGYFPARRAAAIDPIEALRYE